MKKQIESPVYKRAYYVASWGEKIIKGHAFELTFIDWHEQTKAFFIPDGKQFPEKVDKMQVEYTTADAEKLLTKEIGSRIEYYEKQLREHSDKLKELKACKAYYLSHYY